MGEYDLNTRLQADNGKDDCDTGKDNRDNGFFLIAGMEFDHSMKPITYLHR